MAQRKQRRKEVLLSDKTTVYRILKRVIDITISLALLILLLPVYLFISYRIYKKEGKTIFYKERRVGLNNRAFIMWTFRTMTNRSQVIRTLPPRPVPKTWDKGVPNKFSIKTYGRQTLTETGALLKKYGLHKIPQFIHVLKGEMSLVGPEPEIPEIAEHYNAYQAKRQKVKPGITGYAQIHGCSNEQHHQKIAKDVYYIKHYSFKLDMHIILKAIKRKLIIN